MAKVKVISGKVSHKGDVLDIGKCFEIDRDNAIRLCKCGLCEMLSDEESAPAEEISEANSLEDMTKAELIEYAANNGIEVDGKDTKAKIIEKITSADMPATDIPQ